ncbi:MAG TPA: MBL fold metallo-hydrolase [Pseudonocardia sp.]|jgi:7,8-dihydropterin-6-yl-methyl-4-(beta-D-ribofuranosyl)aminobenzene 5'-phosphate synthase
MCDSSTAGALDVRAALPRPAPGPAADPVRLEPVDQVEITVLVDNVYDALLTGDERTVRTGMRVADAPAPQFDGGATSVGLLAEHGFSALVRVRRGAAESTLLFDTGLSPDAMVTNADRMGVDLASVRGVVLSHGHFDHAGGLAGLARRRGSLAMPMVLHPRAWARRRMALPGQEPREMPTLSPRALAAEGFEVVERREPSLLLDGSVLITGEVDRTTDFEHGMPAAHQAWDDGQWRHDPAVADDQALLVHVRGRGLVVLTGCGHAGAVNIVRHARRLTGVDRLHALVGGLHLGGPAFEPVIPPTVAELTALAPDLVVPGHCTGWRAQHALAAALPDAWVQGSSGSTFRLTGTSAEAA